jgi:hypothetical protein
MKLLRILAHIRKLKKTRNNKVIKALGWMHQKMISEVWDEL